MTAEEYVKKSREELQRKFGYVGLKKHCGNYDGETGRCNVCNIDHDRHCLPCAFSVCYFYSNKEEEKR